MDKCSVSNFLKKKLSTSDFSKCLNKLVKAGVVEEVVEECLDNMDASVGHDLKVKFLIIQTLSSKDQLEGVLKSFGFITPEYDNSDQISEDHISELTKYLTPVAFKYNDLGVALGLKKWEIENLLHNSTKESVVVKLHTLLSECISKGLTVASLTNALREIPMNEGKLANTIEKEFPMLAKRKREEDEEMHDVKRPKKNGRKEILMESTKKNVEVEEGKSLLLYVEANPGGEDDFTYQWTCPGEEVEYIGSTTSVLCIKKACLSIDQNVFTCRVHKGNDLNTAASRDIKISVHCLLDKYQEQLKPIYCHSDSEVDWPESAMREVKTLDVTIVESKKIKCKKTKKAYTRETVTGNIEDTLKDKVIIDYDTMCSNLVPSTRVLIEGRPGCGKTKLVDRVCKDWAAGNTKLKSKLVIKVSLRQIPSDIDSLKLEHLLDLNFCENKDLEKLSKYACDNNGNGFCFIFDGLDEISLYGQSKRINIIFELFTSKVLPLSIVILTSRPSATHNWRRYASKHLEVIGFLRSDIFEFINNYDFECDRLSFGLTQYLKSHPNLLNVCYLPINTLIVAFLYNRYGDDFSCNTETELYRDCVNVLLERNKEKTGGIVEETIQKHLHHIHELAYKSTIAGKVVIFDHHLQSTDSQDASLGLVVEDKAICLKWETYHTFFHLTFQEYFSACHFSQLSKEDQLSIVEENKDKMCLREMWKFYFGLEEAIDEVKEKILRNSPDTLFLVHCLYESKEKRVDGVSLEELSFTKEFINSRDFAGIAFVLSTFPKIETLSFESCTFNKEGVQAFLDEIENFQLLLEEVRFRHFKCHGEDDFLRAIRSFIESMPSLKIIDFIDTSIKKKHADILFTKLRHDEVEIIKLSSISEVIVDELLEAVPNWKNFAAFELTEVPSGGVVEKFRAKSKLGLIAESLIDDDKRALDLKDHRLKGTHLSEIFNTICGSKKWKRCHSLHVGCSDLGKSETSLMGPLSKCLNSCNELEELYLDHNHIKGIRLKQLKSALDNCPLLSVLDLNHNPLLHEGASVLSGVFQSLSLLTTLNISNCSLKTEGMNLISKALPHLEELKQLHIRDNNIHNEGAINLAKHLRHCKKIQKLNAGNNGIGDKGFAALLGCLSRNCPEINEFLLDGNKIEGEEILTVWKPVYARIVKFTNLRNNPISSDTIQQLIAVKQEPNPDSDLRQNSLAHVQAQDLTTECLMDVTANEGGCHGDGEVAPTTTSDISGSTSENGKTLEHKLLVPLFDDHIQREDSGIESFNMELSASSSTLSLTPFSEVVTSTPDQHNKLRELKQGE